MGAPDLRRGHHLVLDSLDVSQPYPYLRLWARWGLGGGGAGPVAPHPRWPSHQHQHLQMRDSHPSPQYPPRHPHASAAVDDHHGGWVRTSYAKLPPPPPERLYHTDNQEEHDDFHYEGLPPGPVPSPPRPQFKRQHPGVREEEDHGEPAERRQWRWQQQQQQQRRQEEWQRRFQGWSERAAAEEEAWAGGVNATAAVEREEEEEEGGGGEAWAARVDARGGYDGYHHHDDNAYVYRDRDEEEGEEQAASEHTTPAHGPAHMAAPACIPPRATPTPATPVVAADGVLRYDRAQLLGLRVPSTVAGAMAEADDDAHGSAAFQALPVAIRRYHPKPPVVRLPPGLQLETKRVPLLEKAPQPEPTRDPEEELVRQPQPEKPGAAAAAAAAGAVAAAVVAGAAAACATGASADHSKRKFVMYSVEEMRQMGAAAPLTPLRVPTNTTTTPVTAPATPAALAEPLKEEATAAAAVNAAAAAEGAMESVDEVKALLARKKIEMQAELDRQLWAATRETSEVEAPEAREKNARVERSRGEAVWYSTHELKRMGAAAMGAVTASSGVYERDAVEAVRRNAVEISTAADRFPTAQPLAASDIMRYSEDDEPRQADRQVERVAAGDEERAVAAAVILPHTHPAGSVFARADVRVAAVFVSDTENARHEAPPPGESAAATARQEGTAKEREGVDPVASALATATAATATTATEEGGKEGGVEGEDSEGATTSSSPASSSTKRTYTADELRALNVASCHAPPPGFRIDPGWAASTRPPAKQKGADGGNSKSRGGNTKCGGSAKGKGKAAEAAAAEAVKVDAAADVRRAAELDATRAAANAILSVDTSQWSLWATDPPAIRQRLVDRSACGPDHVGALAAAIPINCGGGDCSAVDLTVADAAAAAASAAASTSTLPMSPVEGSAGSGCVDSGVESDMFDVATMFQEPEFLLESAAVVRALRLRVDARSSTTAAFATSTDGGGEVHSGVQCGQTVTVRGLSGGSVDFPGVEVVTFPPGALTAFARSIVEASGALRPYAVVEPSLGVVFGTWSRREAEDEDGGEGREEAGGGWCATVDFLQPWEGQPSELVTWVNAEEAAAAAAAAAAVARGRDAKVGVGADEGASGDLGHVRASTMIRPIGWLQTTPATGPALTEEVRAAFDLQSETAKPTTVRGSISCGGGGGERRPPSASSLFVSVDIIRSALPGGAGGGACVEVFDLRTGAVLDFELSGADEGEED